MRRSESLFLETKTRPPSDERGWSPQFREGPSRGRSRGHPRTVAPIKKRTSGMHRSTDAVRERRESSRIHCKNTTHRRLRTSVVRCIRVVRRDCTHSEDTRSPKGQPAARSSSCSCPSEGRCTFSQTFFTLLDTTGRLTERSYFTRRRDRNPQLYSK